jgi:3-hydroxybutyryl-CoA dehydrogenase
MGAGIVEVCLAAGHDVIAYDGFPEAREKGLARVHKGFTRRVEKGTLEQTDADAALGRLTTVEAIADLRDVDIVIEAIAEIPEVKHELFRELGATLQPQAILATNTSAISVTGIAEASGHPERVVGLHFFNPAPVMKLVEVVRTTLVDPQVYADAIEFAEGLDKEAVPCPDTPGFLVNRVLVPMLNDAVRTLAETGADPVDLDRALKAGAGWPMGPLALMCSCTPARRSLRVSAKRILRRIRCSYSLWRRASWGARRARAFTRTKRARGNAPRMRFPSA